MVETAREAMFAGARSSTSMTYLALLENMGRWIRCPTYENASVVC